jgi:two-component system, OmpR family, phosphate regulon sensor histidine kinase PhoR
MNTPKPWGTSSVELAPLFWRLFNENEDKALNKGMELRVCPTNVSVVSHPLLLNGILQNLLSNAIKYTEPGGRILIGCRQVKSHVRVDVYDTGIGISPEHRPKIFEAFERLDPTRCDGIGIGLFIVLRAVELLGRKIELSSIVPLGSRFSIFVPRSSAMG